MEADAAQRERLRCKMMCSLFLVRSLLSLALDMSTVDVLMDSTSISAFTPAVKWALSSSAMSGVGPCCASKASRVGRSLSSARRNAPFAQMGTKGMPHGMNIHGPVQSRLR